jgi:hypothetical protein
MLAICNLNKFGYDSSKVVGYNNIIQYLIAKGADILKRSDDGRTALNMAINYKQSDIISKLSKALLDKIYRENQEKCSICLSNPNEIDQSDACITCCCNNFMCKKDVINAANGELEGKIQAEAEKMKNVLFSNVLSLITLGQKDAAGSLLQSLTNIELDCKKIFDKFKPCLQEVDLCSQVTYRKFRSSCPNCRSSLIFLNYQGKALAAESNRLSEFSNPVFRLSL